MRSQITICALLLILALAQCGEAPSSSSTTRPESKYATVIEWSDGVSLHSVLYKVDGKIIGRGKDAFKLVFKHIESLPEKSLILIKMPADIANVLADRTGGEDPFPFEGYESERKQFGDLGLRRHLSIVTEKFAQKAFVN